MAIQARRPAAGLVVHSDRGGRYEQPVHGHADQIWLRLQHEPQRYCWDNAVAERFSLNLKMKRVWQYNYANKSNLLLRYDPMDHNVIGTSGFKHFCASIVIVDLLDGAIRSRERNAHPHA
jgi:transposase InsO family protein